MFSFTVLLLYFQIDNLKLILPYYVGPTLSGYIRKWYHKSTSNWWSSWCVVWTNSTQQRLAIELEGYIIELANWLLTTLTACNLSIHHEHDVDGYVSLSEQLSSFHHNNRPIHTTQAHNYYFQIHNDYVSDEINIVCNSYWNLNTITLELQHMWIAQRVIRLCNWE